MTTRSRLWRGAAALATLSLLTAACGDDDDATDTDDTEQSSTSSTSGSASGVIEVTAVDYGYEGLDDEISAGSTLSLTNDSDIEAHEIVAFLLPEGEERSAEELFELGEDEFGAVVGGPPATVIVALPGEEGQPVFGGGTLTAPGRYIYACFIPVGADPALYEEAMASGSQEPPELPEDSGPPHFTQGMFGEVRVS